MPYTLTLTHDERKAIDWIGNRYFHGEAFRTLLMRHDVPWHATNVDWQFTDNPEWDNECDIIFTIPEHIAWQIRDGIESEDFELACIGGELRTKLLAFVDSII